MGACKSFETTIMSNKEERSFTEMYSLPVKVTLVPRAILFLEKNVSKRAERQFRYDKSSVKRIEEIRYPRHERMKFVLIFSGQLRRDELHRALLRLRI